MGCELIDTGSLSISYLHYSSSIFFYAIVSHLLLELTMLTVVH